MTVAPGAVVSCSRGCVGSVGRAEVRRDVRYKKRPPAITGGIEEEAKLPTFRCG